MKTCSNVIENRKLARAYWDRPMHDWGLEQAKLETARDVMNLREAREADKRKKKKKPD